MKNIKITIPIVIGICAILLLSLSSCNTGEYPKTTSKFVVTQIKPNKTNSTSIYLLEPIESMDLNMYSTWIVDSVGKFNAGDTLYFTKSN